MVLSPWFCVCHKWNHVHKTMVLAHGFVHVTSLERPIKASTWACVWGGWICDITNTTIINIIIFVFIFFIFFYFSSIQSFFFSSEQISSNLTLIVISSIIPRTSSPVQDPGGRSSSTHTRESLWRHLVNPTWRAAGEKEMDGEYLMEAISKRMMDLLREEKRRNEAQLAVERVVEQVSYFNSAEVQSFL